MGVEDGCRVAPRESRHLAGRQHGKGSGVAAVSLALLRGRAALPLEAIREKFCFVSQWAQRKTDWCCRLPPGKLRSVAVIFGILLFVNVGMPVGWVVWMRRPRDPSNASSLAASPSPAFAYAQERTSPTKRASR